MHLVERFTRTGGETLDYEFTVEDLESFARAWTGAFPPTQDAGLIYETSCHEGNYSMPLIPNGARVQERAGGGVWLVMPLTVGSRLGHYGVAAVIKVRVDGTVKVLDFWLAQALDTVPEGDPSQSPTLTAATTQMGVVLATS